MIVLILVPALATGLLSPGLPSVPPSVDSITAAELRMHLEFLASDELGGRYSLSPTFGIAARYLASRLRGYGFHGPSGHADMLQRFDVISTQMEADKTFLTITIDHHSSKHGLGEFAVLQPASMGDAQAPIVFAGYGISSPSQNHDDYAGLDVKGKIVLVMAGAPAGIDSSALSDNEEKEHAAAAHGAIGFLAIPSERMAERLKDRGF